MAVSEFITLDKRANTAKRRGVLSVNDHTPQMGDDNCVAGFDLRSSIVMTFDLDDPSVGSSIINTHIIDSVKIKFEASLSQSAGSPNDIHHIALMSSDGYWDRPLNDPRQFAQSGIFYGPASFTSTIPIDLLNGFGVTFYETLADRGGSVIFSTGSNRTGTFACTFHHADGAAGIIYVNMYLRKIDLDGTDPSLVLKIYDVLPDGRNGAINNLVASSHEKAYSSLNANAVTKTTFNFLSDQIPSVSGGRWLCAVIEGDWFTGDYSQGENQISTDIFRREDNLDTYQPGTLGSFFQVNTILNTSDDINNVARMYYYADDFPCLYDQDLLGKITTPYERAYGSTMIATGVGDWVQSTLREYGSSTSGADEIFTNMKEEVQNWIDKVGSSSFDNLTSHNFIGFIWEVFEPVDAFWTMKDNPTLIIEYHPNSAPIITSTGIADATALVLYTYNVIATDVDSQTLVYSLDVSPTGMVIDSGTGVITWTPTTPQIGSHNVIVKVEDTYLASDTEDYNISVLALTAPVITSTAITMTFVSVLYTYAVTFVDPNPLDTHTFSLDVFPSGMIINSSSGVITWTPLEAQAGNHSVTVRVTDSGGLFGTQSYNLGVTFPPEQQPVGFLTGTLKIEQAIGFKLKIQDTVSIKMVFEESVDSTSKMDAAVSGKLIIKPSVDGKLTLKVN